MEQIMRGGSLMEKRLNRASREDVPKRPRQY
jgi:hypothetical protein